MDTLIKLGAGALVAYLLLKPKDAAAAAGSSLTAEDCPTCGGAGKTTESYGTNLDKSGGSDFTCTTCEGSGGVITTTDTTTGEKEVVAPEIPGLKKVDAPKQDGMAPGTFVDPRTQQTGYEPGGTGKGAKREPEPGVTIRLDPGFTRTPQKIKTDVKFSEQAQTFNAALNQTGMYSGASDEQVALCALKVAADAGDLNAKTQIGVMLANGTVKQGDLLACDQRPQTSNTGRVPDVVRPLAQRRVPVFTPAAEDSRGTVGGKAVLPAINPRNPILPGFGRR